MAATTKNSRTDSKRSSRLPSSSCSLRVFDLGVDFIVARHRRDMLAIFRDRHGVPKPRCWEDRELTPGQKLEITTDFGETAQKMTASKIARDWGRGYYEEI